MRSVPVWDFPTRVFHWALAIAVVTSYATGDEDGVSFIVHTASGYAVALLLVFRLVWGFVGSAHSRFSDFVYSGRSVKDYAKQLLRFDPPRFVGHNPLGGWMIILMLAVLAGTVVTGLFSGNDDGGGAGILLPLIAAPGGEGLAEVHEFFGNFILVLAAIHVLAVFVDWFLTGDNLVKAMITGHKSLDDEDAGNQRPLASRWRSAVVAVIVAGLGAILFQQTDFGAIASAGERGSYEHRSESEDVDND
jgi:cytochrome b